MDAALEALTQRFMSQASWVVLGGAGMSTDSGIPDYRDESGQWKHAEPIQFQEFAGHALCRQRYWARSFLGWQRFSRASPNAGHEILAKLESRGKVGALITQNVDGLHQAAGSQSVIDLHGKLDTVRCLDCLVQFARLEFQKSLKDSNPDWHARVFRYRADGDAELAESSHESFIVPGCPHCGGIAKPDVVMFGESVPRARVETAMAAIDQADGLLVAGSSLMLFSGFRFVRRAVASAKPVLIINQGHTRADDIATHKFSGNCTVGLDHLLRAVDGATARTIAR
tara:strand:- start:877 stop:1728 length:852 start_codon:yes stop_codon:yes gene_type:complete